MLNPVGCLHCNKMMHGHTNIKLSISLCLKKNVQKFLHYKNI